MKIEMTIPERLYTMGALPKEGSFITLRLVRELNTKLGFSADEITNFEITEEEGLVKWNAMGNDPVEIEFADSELDVIKVEFKKLDSENKLNMNLFSIYEKIFMR
jgi:hypothetical protein